MADVEVRKATKKLENRGRTLDILRVAAYARVSTDSKEQLESYHSQMKHYRDMVTNNPEWQLVEVYADEAITATLLDKRDNFNRMINDAMNGKIDMIIVKSISRFARNTVDALQLVRMLKDKNIAVFFEEENINTLSMDGELLLTILSSVAQQEVQNISDHVKKGLAMKMQRGEMVGFNGCLGYDYNPEDKTISVNEKEAETVRYIFKRYLQGAGGAVIARELKNLGYVNKKGDTNWSASGIVGIIKNEKYKGDLLMGKTFTVDPINKRRLENLGESDQYYTKNHHEAIISREEFEEAQKLLARRNLNRKSGRQDKFSRQYAFSCMMKCGFCGGTLSRRSWNSRTNYRKTIWQCVTATKKGKTNCPYCKGIPEDLIEKAFVQSYNVLCKNNETMVDDFIKRVESTLQSENKGNKVTKCENDIVKIKQRKSQLVDMFLDDKIDDEIYQTKLSELESKLNKLYQDLEELKILKEKQEDVNKRLKAFTDTIKGTNILTEFDRYVFESIIDRVIVGETGEDGTKYPYTLTFIYKTGMEKKVALKQPLSFNNVCSHASDEGSLKCLHASSDTCGDGGSLVPTKAG